MVARSVAPEKFVFVDECGRHTSMAALYGYAPEGERLRLRVPRRRGKNTTVLSSMTIEGMGPTLVVEGATTARVFETYVEKVLAPSLSTIQHNYGDVSRYSARLDSAAASVFSRGSTIPKYVTVIPCQST
jgi:hypothetical protein